MLKRYLLDTNAIIYGLNSGAHFLSAHYALSVITEIELFSFGKLTDSEESVLREVLSNFRLIELTREIRIETISIRKRYKLKLPDSIIVATAMVHDAALVTFDKQLLEIKDIQVIEPKKLVIGNG